MNVHQTITAQLNMAQAVLGMLLHDLSDDDLLARTSPQANHVAWQLGHLIQSERNMLAAVCPGKAPELPDSFAQLHDRTPEALHNSAGFLTKQEYLSLYDQQRKATLAALDELSSDDFDKPGIEKMARMAPTVGDTFILMGGHQMWHIGQITALRRHLGKPVVV